MGSSDENQKSGGDPVLAWPQNPKSAEVLGCGVEGLVEMEGWGEVAPRNDGNNLPAPICPVSATCQVLSNPFPLGRLFIFTAGKMHN